MQSALGHLRGSEFKVPRGALGEPFKVPRGARKAPQTGAQKHRPGEVKILPGVKGSGEYGVRQPMMSAQKICAAIAKSRATGSMTAPKGQSTSSTRKGRRRGLLSWPVKVASWPWPASPRAHTIIGLCQRARDRRLFIPMQCTQACI